jgi:hypothetical protein
MGFPKIPDPKEIADMTAEAMEPMVDLLTEVRDLLRDNNALQREQNALMTGILFSRSGSES